MQLVVEQASRHGGTLERHRGLSNRVFSGRGRLTETVAVEGVRFEGEVANAGAWPGAIERAAARPPGHGYSWKGRVLHHLLPRMLRLAGHADPDCASPRANSNARDRVSIPVSVQPDWPRERCSPQQDSCA